MPFTGFQVNAVKFMLVRLEDLCMRELWSITETTDFNTDLYHFRILWPQNLTKQLT